MSNNSYRPGPQRPRTASQIQYEAMQRRISERFGEFGERDAANVSHDPLEDNHVRPILR